MKLEDQVCSLELAKKLKELGVKQESLFYREVTCGTIWRDEELMDAKGVLHDDDCVSAFTVAELFKEHYDRFGCVDVPSKIEPEKLADHLAEKLCQKLSQ